MAERDCILRELAATAAELRQLEQVRDHLIRRALEAGCSYRELEQVAGLPRATLHRRHRHPWRER